MDTTIKQYRFSEIIWKSTSSPKQATYKYKYKLDTMNETRFWYEIYRAFVNKSALLIIY